MKSKKRKIGEVLLENKLITPEILKEALDYQSKYGGGLTQYLIAYGYINEEELAKCISAQFGYPYLPLRVYDIPDEIIKLVPVDVAERYWLVPVDRIKNILTVVMSDPLDEDAIKEVERISGYSVQPFVGLLSDIIKAIEYYYNIIIEDDRLKKHKLAPLFINVNGYKGFERRKSVRLKTFLDIHFPVQDLYKKSSTKDISLHGLLFESDNILPINSYVVIQINLPKDFCPTPLATVAQIARVIPLKNNKFDIGVKIIRMPKEDVNMLLRYARLHEE